MPNEHGSGRVFARIVHIRRDPLPGSPSAEPAAGERPLRAPRRSGPRERPPAGGPGRLGRWTRAHPVWAVVGAVSAVALAAGGIVAGAGGGTGRAARAGLRHRRRASTAPGGRTGRRPRARTQARAVGSGPW